MDCANHRTYTYKDTDIINTTNATQSSSYVLKSLRTHRIFPFSDCWPIYSDIYKKKNHIVKVTC